MRWWGTALILETYANDLIGEVLDDDQTSTIDVQPYLDKQYIEIIRRRQLAKLAESFGSSRVYHVLMA